MAQKPHTHTEHGVERADPYYWLRERDNPDVIAYLEAENSYAASQTSHLGAFRTALFDEMVGCWLHVFLYRRRLLCLMRLVFYASKGHKPEE